MCGVTLYRVTRNPPCKHLSVLTLATAELPFGAVPDEAGQHTVWIQRAPTPTWEVVLCEAEVSTNRFCKRQSMTSSGLDVVLIA